MSNKIQSILGIVLGVISIIFAILMFCHLTGNFVPSYTFGADYYTESYQALNHIVTNTVHTNQILRSGFGFLFLIIGFKLLIKNIFGLITKKVKVEEPKQEEN